MSQGSDDGNSSAFLSVDLQSYFCFCTLAPCPESVVTDRLSVDVFFIRDSWKA